MKKYVLDTNLYVLAIRIEEAAEELEAYFSRFVPVTYLSSVVLHELLVGAKTPAKAEEVRNTIAGPFRRTGRVITPSANSWEDAAVAVAAIAKHDRRDLRTLSMSLIHDVLLAASCREAGVTLVTENIDDFELVARFIKITCVPPWPS